MLMCELNNALLSFALINLGSLLAVPFMMKNASGLISFKQYCSDWRRRQRLLRLSSV